MVEVAAFGWSVAVGEGAVVVAELDLAADPVGDLVGVHGLVAVEVDHRPHDHRGARGGEPVLDLGHEGGLAGDRADRAALGEGERAGARGAERLSEPAGQSPAIATDGS